jgi:hypothetical protein
VPRHEPGKRNRQSSRVIYPLEFMEVRSDDKKHPDGCAYCVLAFRPVRVGFRTYFCAKWRKALAVFQSGVRVDGFDVIPGIMHVGTGWRPTDGLAGLRRGTVRNDKAGTRVAGPRLNDERRFVMLLLDRYSAFPNLQQPAARCFTLV